MVDDNLDRPTAWEETGAVIRPAAWGGRSTPASASSNAAASPSEREFIAILAPCLQLVAPASMDMETQDAWLEAARLALADVPLGQLRDGARVAMRTADHPSKIVPAIIAEAIRQQFSADSVNRVWQGADNDPRALPAPGDERPTDDEVDAICRRFSVGRYARVQPQRDPARPVRVTTDADPSRPCRTPTREDYIRLGVDPATLDGLGIGTQPST